MSARKKQIHLGLFINPVGHTLGAWQRPEVPPNAAVDFAHIASLAQKAEAAKFDLVFFADTVAERGGQAQTPQWSSFEPTTLLAALATVTERIGLVATASTTYNEPYNVARRYASLDIISGGRTGWNLVTTSFPPEALNFNRKEHVPHAERYVRAHEFAHVVKGLWDSWEDDAFLRDKSSGTFFDPTKQHLLNHRGQHFSVRGPLNAPRSPQGHPVIFQAGSSEPGKELAAETAEAIFTVQSRLEDAVSFYADVKGRLPKFGRDRDAVKILPGLAVYVGRTEAEARENYEELKANIPLDDAIELLSAQLGGFDLSGYPPDGPIPPLPPSNAAKQRRELILAAAERENLSIAESALRHAVTTGHFEVVGTPEQVADQLEEWIDKEACDGFNLKPSRVPGHVDEFIELVLPELRRRGRFRDDYSGTTLRSHLGLAAPLHPARQASLEN